MQEKKEQERVAAAAAIAARREALEDKRAAKEAEEAKKAERELRAFLLYSRYRIDYLYNLDVSPTGQILKDCRNAKLLVKKKTLQVLTEAQKKNRQEEKEKLNCFVQELPCKE